MNGNEGKKKEEEICLKLLNLLHELKHGEYTAEQLNLKLYELFPHWREVEWFNGTDAFNYLFNVVFG